MFHILNNMASFLGNFFTKVITSALLFVSLPLAASSCYIEEGTQNSRPIKVTYFALEGEFWQLQQDLLIAAAKDLGVELDIMVNGTDNHLQFLERLGQKIKQEGKPDYLLGYFYHNYDDLILPFIEQHQLNYFSINTSLNKSVSLFTGKPRDKYKYWLGHMAPDDYSASKNVIKSLAAGRAVDEITLAMLGGDFDSTTVGLNRSRGVSNYALSHGIKALPFIHSGWYKKGAEQAMDNLLYRKADFNTVWTGAADIALGVLKSMKKHGLNVTSKTRIGTFDWTPKILDLVKSDDIFVAYGGHFTESARALILLVDHANGLDFKQELGVDIKTQLRALDKQNAGQRERLINKDNWAQIDFKSMSRCFNPELNNYRFSQL